METKDEAKAIRLLVLEQMTTETAVIFAVAQTAVSRERCRDPKCGCRILAVLGDLLIGVARYRVAIGGGDGNDYAIDADALEVRRRAVHGHIAELSAALRDRPGAASALRDTFRAQVPLQELSVGPRAVWGAIDELLALASVQVRAASQTSSWLN